MIHRHHRFDAGYRNELHQGVERSQQRLFVRDLQRAIILPNQRQGHCGIQRHVRGWIGLQCATRCFRGRRPQSRQGLPNCPLGLSCSRRFLQFDLRRRLLNSLRQSPQLSELPVPCSQGCTHIERRQPPLGTGVLGGIQFRLKRCRIILIPGDARQHGMQASVLRRPLQCISRSGLGFVHAAQSCISDGQVLISADGVRLQLHRLATLVQRAYELA